MTTAYAKHFYEIAETVDQDEDLRKHILDLVESEPITGKALAGSDRRAEFRRILEEFFNGENDLTQTITDIQNRLPRSESPHRGDNRTFADGWDERLARTQISRFYNQAVLERLDERGEEKCFVPNSDHQDPDTKCTVQLAGSTVDVETLLERLQRAYRDGDYHSEPKIPNHPHCTHTVTPAESD